MTGNKIKKRRKGEKPEAEAVPLTRNREQRSRQGEGRNPRIFLLVESNVPGNQQTQPIQRALFSPYSQQVAGL